jgi:hypothetical protein
VLIHIDNSAASDAAADSATSALSRTCIENLLHAHFEGNHVVSLRPDDAAALRSASPPWSARAQRALDHIDESYSQIEGLREDIAWSMELGLGPGFDCATYEPRRGKKVVRASLHRFDRMGTAICSALLGENSTDAELFYEFARMRRADLRWDGVEISHEPRGTGGSTFAPEYKKLAQQGRILLAIADGDRRHPGGGLGGTYHDLETEARGHPAYQRARSLPTRTAEALVPLSVYREAFTFKNGSSDQRLGAVARLEQLVRSAPAGVVLYAHYKDGVTLFDAENAKNAAEQSYWCDVAKKANRDQCVRSTSEQCKKRDECRCFVVDALGGKALSDVVAFLTKQKSKKGLAARFRLTQDPALTELADEVLSWGLALPPLLT